MVIDSFRKRRWGKTCGRSSRPVAGYYGNYPNIVEELSLKLRRPRRVAGASPCSYRHSFCLKVFAGVDPGMLAIG